VSAGESNWTILAVLDWTRAHFESKGMDTPRLDAEVLIAQALKMPRVMLYARYDQPLNEEERASIRGLVQRRARGEPIARIIGEKELWSMSFEVTRDVLIPRPDTETLVEVAIRLLGTRERPIVADIGTGSGCIALAIAKNVSSARVYAVDRSKPACDVALRNTHKHGLADRVTVLEGDLLRALPVPHDPLDLVAANLPYIPTPDIEGLAREVRDFEPRSALDGGSDGLDLIRRLIAEAGPHLRSGGVLLLEIGHDQSARVVDLLARAGYAALRVHRDLGGHDRVVEATWP
jgi:release factor glutamine methyltransferase